MRDVKLQSYYDRTAHFLLAVSHDEASLSVGSSATEPDLAFGFAARIKTADGEVPLAYWSSYRDSAQTAPQYDKDLNVLVGVRIYQPMVSRCAFRLRSSLLSREFVVVSEAFPQSIKYKWPIYREFAARVFGDPFNFVSKDFAFELGKIIEAYCPSAYT